MLGPKHARFRVTPYAVVGLVLGLCVGCGGDGQDEQRPDRLDIFLSMKGPGAGNPFWADVERGAREAADSLDVNLTVLAPQSEADVETQIAQIEDQLAREVDGIMVAPADMVALNPVFEKARAKGIPVVFVDTKADWDHSATFVGTNNVVGGRLAGAYLCEVLGEDAEVALITGVMSHQTHIDRVKGVKEMLAECGIHIVAEQQANTDRALGQAVMENILTAHQDLGGVFAGADLMALGAIRAAKAAGRLDDLVFVGFDGIPEAIESIRVGEMDATVMQRPYEMGRIGLESAVRAIKGEALPEHIDTGTEIVTVDALSRR